MKIPLSILALMAAPLAVTPQLFGQVALDGPWYTGSNAGTPTLSATNSDTFSWGSGAADTGTVGSGVLWTNFSAQSLANDGDSVEISYTLEFSGATPGNTDAAVRLGLFDSNGTTRTSNLSGTNGDAAFNGWEGYQVFLDGAGGGGVGSQFRNTSNLNNAPLGSGPTTPIGTNIGSATYAVDTPYAFSFSITRDTATQYTVAMSGFGITDSRTTTNIVASSFDSFMIQATGSVPDTSVFNFSNVSVIPEPASFALIFGALAGCLVVNRRRGRA